jgi:glycosyltransferase involved in cell wall biosynthesis
MRTIPLSVSVAMTTFDGAPHLARQLASIAAQSYPPDEVVIFDDASSDETWSIIDEFERVSPVPVRPHRQERNVGLHRNIQDALRACTGSVIVLADQDDIWDPDKLAAIAHVFGDPDLMVWFSNAELIDEDDATMGTDTWSAVHFGVDEQRSINSVRGIRRLLHGMTVTGATMAVRREVVDLALPLPPELDGPDFVYYHDGWLAVLGALRGQVIADPTLLTRYRRHARQTTANKMEPNDATVGPEPRSTRLALDATRVALVADRVRERQAGQRFRGEMVEYLFELDDLFRVRTLPRGAPGRRTQILRQLVTGQYGRHARGLRTAARDFAR